MRNIFQICLFHCSPESNLVKKAVPDKPTTNSESLQRINNFALDFALIVTKQLMNKQNGKIFLISPNILYCLF